MKWKNEKTQTSKSQPSYSFLKYPEKTTAPVAQLVKNLPAMQETQFNSWVGKIRWRRDGLPTWVLLGFPGGSDGKESACNAGHLVGRSPGKGIGYSLQYSGLQNSMEKGSWRATVHGVTKSQTHLRDFHFHPKWTTTTKKTSSHHSHFPTNLKPISINNALNSQYYKCTELTQYALYSLISYKKCLEFKKWRLPLKILAPSLDRHWNLRAIQNPGTWCKTQINILHLLREASHQFTAKQVTRGCPWWSSC